MWFLRLLLGRRLANSEGEQQKIGVLTAVPAMGLDGLASAAYGPEAALTVLIPLGAVGLAYMWPIIVGILVLLGLLFLSYRQTIKAYPSNGGSYTVARENLGTFAGLLAAAALSLDYILNVAVAISAGVAALVSMAPVLQPYTLVICLGILTAVTVMNLRGTGEAGWAFAFPTYLFIVTLGGVVVVGVIKALLSGGRPAPVDTPPELPAATAAVGFWLLIRAFASGCTAMTGVEAVSNGVSAFRDPVVPNARRTMAVIVGVLGVFLGGIGYLVRCYRIGAMDQDSSGYQSLLSQLTGAVFGRGVLYYITMASVLAVLCLSANTSFVDFPRLCRLLARDDYLPRVFGVMGRRLVYSGGILFLAGAAALLLIGFGGITDRLIPLFAVGAFLAFTLSQAGMVVHWRRQRQHPGDDGKRGRWSQGVVSMFINGTGAVSTACTLGVIVLAKFTAGAWITLLAMPLLVALFYSVKHHYRRMERRLATQRPLDLRDAGPPIVILPAIGWNRLTRQALRFAMQLSPDVIAVHLGELSGDETDEEDRKVREQWQRNVETPAREVGAEPPRLQIINSPYREFIEPLLGFIRAVQQESAGRTVAVLIPELVERHWWQKLLHNHRGARLRRALLAHGDRGLVVMDLPWHLDPDIGPAKPAEPVDDAGTAADAAVHKATAARDRHQSAPAAFGGREVNSRRPQAS